MLRKHRQINQIYYPVRIHITARLIGLRRKGPREYCEIHKINCTVAIDVRTANDHGKTQQCNTDIILTLTMRTGRRQKRRLWPICMLDGQPIDALHAQLAHETVHHLGVENIEPTLPIAGPEHTETARAQKSNQLPRLRSLGIDQQNAWGFSL